MDVIFSSGNGIAGVDDLWFDHAASTRRPRHHVSAVPPEEMIWSKAFIQERERFDGADVLHLLRDVGPSLDWRRLIDSVRTLGGCCSPISSVRVRLPGPKVDRSDWVMDGSILRFSAERDDLADEVCNGTLLSREQYAYDLNALCYDDGRVEPRGRLTPHEVDIWTAAIDGEKSPRTKPGDVPLSVLRVSGVSHDPLCARMERLRLRGLCRRRARFAQPYRDGLLPAGHLLPGIEPDRSVPFT